ncbi:hypothetical protein NA57DRAFT_80071 [Rhizodiscina lignyota]|uniref:Large ribosomal subunit protein uL23m n=1 Tax=Rhizodiscina lignyota TaxID=1504668 RepID=A0A9P4M534_9PEZI|nr:hypothetical protein NA57DRAFT_80071 [Rhizodiscina lignyota]
MATAMRKFGNIFKVIGQKEIYLPPIKAVVTLLRTKHLPPTFARFRVPLNWNKLDLKDYLYHAYGVEALHVRSVVRISPIQPNKPAETRASKRQWHRPISTKYMTIRMEKPFVWPEEPKDYTPWDRKGYNAANAMRDEEEEKLLPEGKSKLPPDASWLKAEARKLMQSRDSAAR